MGTNIRATCIWYVIAVLVLSTRVSSRTLCPRIFFKNIDEGKMPYKFIEGAFKKLSYKINNFPVYRREDGKLYFYLKEKYPTGYWLLFGTNVASTKFGVGARMKNGLKTFAQSWLVTGILDRNDVFGGLITQWTYYNQRDSKDYNVSNTPYIKAVCVDSDFRQCNSDKVYLNSKFTDGFTNDPKVDFFERETGTFHNLRPVFKHSTKKRDKDIYLQYNSDNYWIVTTSRDPSDHNDGEVLMRVKDYALRPEYIMNIWSIKDSKGWSTKPDLKVRCRGVGSSQDICSVSNPCATYNAFECVYDSAKESICICRPDFYGPQCKKSKKCPTPQADSSEIGFKLAGNLPGNLAMTFCRSSYPPAVRYVVCSEAGHWSRRGTECRRSSTKTTPKPSLDFDDMPDLSIGILVSAVLLQSLLPFVLWCCAMCTTICTEDDDEWEDQETESTQTTKRKNGWYRNSSLLRLYSMDFYISFYLWLIYFTVCGSTQCTQYGSICSQLNIMAIVMLIICPLFVLVESFFSHELSYLNNIMQDDTAWGYIQNMHAVAPVISMTVECYHMETRTRQVHYTDANGNSQTRTETYEERVVTHVDNDVFKYGCWVDVSKREMPALSSEALTRLKIDPVILFGDQETEEDFDRQKEDMLCRNRHRDLNMDFSSSQFIPGLAKRISAYVDLSMKTCWIGTGCFWLATLLMLTWPYRWLFRAKTAKNHYDLKKKMYKSTSPPPDVGIMNPVSTLEVDPSNVNPSFVMTNLSTSARQTDPPHYTGTAYPPNIGSQTYPTANHEPSYPPVNQGAPYPVNQAMAFSPANQGSSHPPTNQEAPYPPDNQQMPDIPPPEYESTLTSM